MPELTDAQKVMRNDTGKRMAAALEALAGTGGRGLPAGGTDGDVLVKNGATDYAAKWTSTPPQMGSLATIEPTSTVTQKTQYVQGEYLVYNGQLYKVTASTITQGQTLDPTPDSGNIRSVTAGRELTEIAKKTTVEGTYNASYVNMSLPCRLYSFIINGIVVISGYFNLSIDISATTSVGNIGFNISGECFATCASPGGTVIRIKAGTNGRIEVESAVPKNNWFSFTMISTL